MATWMYIIPVVVIALIVIIMIPISKKKAKQITIDMERIRDMKVHISMLAGNVKSINGEPEEMISHSYFTYGVDTDGPIDVEFVPNFMHAKTQYTGREPMHICFNAEAGKSYQIDVSPKKPNGDDSTILSVDQLKGGELIFKSTFYIVTKDITETSQAKAMRGIYNG